MRRVLAVSVLVSTILAVALAAVQPVSAAGDEFAGVWGESGAITIEPVGEGGYSLTWEIPESPFCSSLGPGADGLVQIYVDTTAVVIDGVLNFELVLTFCADGSLPVGFVLGARTLTPQADGNLRWQSPGEGDGVLIPRTTTEFFDVLVGKFYTDAVTWLACEGITTGTSTTTFSPDDPVTRGQMATFLWRYDDSPDPASLDTPFIDVPAGRFYSVAVAWLAEEKITTGATPTTFLPDDSVTRGQMATFLWRYSGSPEPASLDTPFSDVPAGKFYSKAVAWLVEQDITTGTTPTTFSPDDPVTRGQMATFLWRLASEPAV